MDTKSLQICLCWRTGKRNHSGKTVGWSWSLWNKEITMPSGTMHQHETLYEHTKWCEKNKNMYMYFLIRHTWHIKHCYIRFSIMMNVISFAYSIRLLLKTTHHGSCYTNNCQFMFALSGMHFPPVHSIRLHNFSPKLIVSKNFLSRGLCEQKIQIPISWLHLLANML